MNSLERVMAAVSFKSPDRVPVIAQVFGHAATLEGVPLGQYLQDGETLAHCQLEALARYGYDAVFSVMDVSVETEAAGSVLRYPDDHYPVIERYALSHDEDLGDRGLLAVPDPERDGRMPEMLKAIRLLRGELGDEVLVVGCVLGPLTLVAQLVGLEAALLLAVDDLPRLEKLMDFATEVVIRFGQAQVQAGAHVPLIFDPAASPAVVPPAFFREFELPRLKRLFAALDGAGAATSWIHIAGPAKPILHLYPAAGIEIANFDYYIEPEEAQAELPETCVNGNIKSLAFLEWTPDAIERAARRLVNAFQERSGFILSSGCEIPPQAEPESVAALVRAALGS